MEAKRFRFSSGLYRQKWFDKVLQTTFPKASMQHQKACTLSSIVQINGILYKSGIVMTGLERKYK